MGARFLADMDCAFIGRMLKELGYDSESVYDVRRRAKANGDGMQRIYKDNAIAKYAAREGRIIITRDWPFYYRLRRANQPAFLIRFDRGQLISKREHIAIILSHYYPEAFKTWLVSRYSFEKNLKYGGDWGMIPKKYPDSKIRAIYDFDPLGYAMKPQHDSEIEIVC